ncbi:hypothetical protein [Cysteiniphilum sp. 6C5]|uniref:hypothetical protein n=1 Tax=unclassified Cysteiniphilum TaxID=2610889 RepID=UPI003F839050
MALSDKKRLAKLLKKKQKRKNKRNKKSKSLHHLTHSDVYLPTPFFGLSDYEQDYNDGHIIIETHIKEINYLSDDYDEFEDEDHDVNPDSTYKGCPVHKLIETTIEYLKILSARLDNKYHFGLDTFYYLSIAVDGWNLAKDHNVDINQVANELEDELDCYGYDIDSDDIISALEFASNEVKNDTDDTCSCFVIESLRLVYDEGDVDFIDLELKAFKNQKSELLEKVRNGKF